MPTYTYKREDGSVFDTMQSINEPPLSECPTTGQPVKRVITGGAGVVYKGSGWYVTDYKGNGSSKEKSSTENKSSVETKTEEKSSSNSPAPAQTPSTSD